MPANQKLFGCPVNSKTLVFCCILTYLSLPLCAHAGIKADSLFRTPAQNRHWLATLKQQALASQWAQIQTRYFEAQEASLPIGPVTALPMLVVDGLVVEQTSTDKRIWDLVATQLTAARVKTIDVMEHEPSGVYVNKAFTGWIVVTVADRTLRKTLQRISRRTQSQ